MKTKVILILITALLEIFSTLIQRLFTENALHSRNRSKVSQFVAWIMYFLLFNGLSYYFAGNVWIQIGAFFGPLLLLLRFLYQERLAQRIYVTVFLYLAGMCSELIAYYMVCSTETEQLIESDVSGFFITVSVISKLLWIHILKILSLFVRKSKTRVSAQEWVEAILAPVGSIVIFLTCFPLEKLHSTDGITEEHFQLLGILALLGINLAAYFLYERGKVSTEKRYRERALKEQCSYYIHQCEETTKLWMEMRQFRHDMKQRSIYVRSLLEQERYEELKQYYDETLEYLQSQKKVASSGCIYFDSIINYKAEVAARDGIVLAAELQIPQDCRVDGDECCVCLGNLLDNAIEAAKEAEPEQRRIALKILAQGNNLYVEIANPYVQPRMQKNGTYLTTKSSSREHGFGLHIINEIVKKHHGELNIQDDGSQFRVTILLYNVLQ